MNEWCAVNAQYAFCKIELANQQTQLLLALSQFKAQLWGPVEVAGRLCFEVLSGNFSGHNGQKHNLDTTQGWSSIMDDLWYKVIWSKFICLLPRDNHAVLHISSMHLNGDQGHELVAFDPGMLKVADWYARETSVQCLLACTWNRFADTC